MDLLFATNNKHKLEEVKALMPEGINILSLDDVSLHVDIPETAPDLEGNAMQKALFIADKTGMNVFADDTGLEVFALNMEPGVFSARYAGQHGDNEANMNKLIGNLKGNRNRGARFRTVIALIINGENHLFEGTVNGKIIENKRGIKGFGYDPIFIPDGETRTFAEMTGKEKNAMSHRGKAIRKMAQFFASSN